MKIWVFEIGVFFCFEKLKIVNLVLFKILGYLIILKVKFSLLILGI